MIFDIVKSSQYSTERRSTIQNLLYLILNEINQKFDKNIFSKFMITLGDEFEGVLIDSSKSYEVFQYVERNFQAQIRCGIGIGPISGVKKEEKSIRRSIELDGVGFHRARTALINAEKKVVFLILNTGNKQFDKIFNMISKLLQTIKSEWTNRQRKYIDYIIAKKPKNPIKETASHFGVTQQATSKALLRAHFHTFVEAEHLLIELVNQPLMIDLSYSTLRG